MTGLITISPEDLADAIAAMAKQLPAAARLSLIGELFASLGVGHRQTVARRLAVSLAKQRGAELL
jgi:hypothetical protein